MCAMLALIVLVLAASVHAGDLECPPGATLRVNDLDRGRGRAEVCVDDAGNLDGPARMYIGDVLRREDSWQSGVQHGRVIVYDERGVKREERFYQAGELAGIETFFHANGVRASVTTYTAGVKQGAVAQWDEAGRPLVEGYFFAGEADGLWHFSPPGEAPYVRVFEAGKPAAPIDPSRGCAAWAEASEAQRTDFVGNFLLKSVAALDLDAKSPGAQLAGYRLRACTLGDPLRVIRSIDAACGTEPREFLPESVSEEIAKVIASCMLRRDVE
jgi:hypothetical protein